MSRLALLGTATVVASLLPASALAAERFVAVGNGSGLLQVEASGASTRLGNAPGPYRTIGLDRRPGGTVLAVDALGGFSDLDLTTRAFTPLFGGAQVATPGSVEGRSTFAVSPDGATAQVGRSRVDLTTAAKSEAGLAGVGTPALDALPDGRLAGIDGTRRAIVVQQADGSFRDLGGLPVELHGPTRFTIAADGRTGWVSTRNFTGTPGRTRLIAVNLATGATDAPRVTVSQALDAIAAIGPAPGTAASEPPTGAPVPVGTAPPGQFAARVGFSVPGKVRMRTIARTGALSIKANVIDPVTVTVSARLGDVEVAKFQRRALPAKVATLRLTPRMGGLVRMRRAAAAGRRLTLRITVADAGGTQTRVRTLALRP